MTMNRNEGRDENRDPISGKPGAHRVQPDIAYGREQVVLIHRHGAEPALPEVAGLLLPGMDGARIGAVQPRQRPPQAVGIGRRQDQVNVVGHQAPGNAANALAPAGLGDQSAIGGVILLAKEYLLPPVAALGDVMRDVGNDDAGQTSHAHQITGFISPDQLGIVSPELQTRRATSRIRWSTAP